MSSEASSQAAARRFLRSMQAAGLRRVPLPVDRPTSNSEADQAPETEPRPDAQTSGTADRPTRPADAEAVLESIAAEVCACERCPLSTTRNKAVPGEGSARASIVFVGEGPGADEDRSGRPFVGRAGRLLDDIITKGMQLRREDVFICNVVKCRPPQNRVPTDGEVEACSGYLERQLRALAPKVICALGATAARRLLNTELPMGRLRGRLHHVYGIPVIPTYHPAYLLRNPEAKRPTWDDIQKVMEWAAK